MTFDDRNAIRSFATVVKSETDDTEMQAEAQNAGDTAEFAIMCPAGAERAEQLDDARGLLDSVAARFEKLKPGLTGSASIRIPKAIRAFEEAINRMLAECASA